MSGIGTRGEQSSADEILLVDSLAALALSGAGQFIVKTGADTFGHATALTAAIVSLGGLTGATQTLATGTTGTDFAISSSGTTHTFNIPDASGSARGLITTGTQSIAGAKTFSTSVAVSVADALTVNGVIVPQTLIITEVLGALDVSKTVFIADGAYQVVSCSAVWGVAGGAAAVLNIEKLTGTTAPGSGIALLTSDLDLTATANTVVNGTLTATTASLQLATGNRLSVKLGGTLTGLVGCAVRITLKRI